MANAGHLVPVSKWRRVGGRARLAAGNLPGRDLRRTHVSVLETGDQLTLLSDGVLEATDAQGDTLRLRRMQAISSQAAEAIAAEALRFGQEDDITVLTLVRMGSGIGDTAQIQAANASW